MLHVKIVMANIVTQVSGSIWLAFILQCFAVERTPCIPLVV
jgi:hypothetical protein